MPILLYIGLLIGAQAFQAVPRLHAAAVVAAIIPNLAAWGAGLIDNALAAAGTTAAELGEEALTERRAGLSRPAHARPGRGAGRHRARRHRDVHPRSQLIRAAIAAGTGAVLSWIGLLHAEEVEWAANPQVALGYLLLGLVLLGIGALQKRSPQPAVDGAEEPAPAPAE